MKLLKTALLASAAVVLAAGAAQANTVSATASAKILKPVTIAQTAQKLNFASIAVDATNGGTVDTANGPSAGTQLIGTPTPAIFSVTGDENLSYTTTLPEIVTLTGPGADMVAHLRFSNNGNANKTLSGVGYLVAGADNVVVNGNLAVAAGQTNGNYSGSYDITVNYP